MVKGYLDILDNNIIKEEDKEVEIPIGVLKGEDSGASKIILEKCPCWKCCNDTLYVFDDHTGM